MTDCPLNDGNHRYFLFKNYDTYEPTVPLTKGLIDEVLYRKVEYAILGCNCGSVIKAGVKDA